MPKDLLQFLAGSHRSVQVAKVQWSLVSSFTAQDVEDLKLEHVSKEISEGQSKNMSHISLEHGVVLMSLDIGEIECNVQFGSSIEIALVTCARWFHSLVLASEQQQTEGDRRAMFNAEVSYTRFQ